MAKAMKTKILSTTGRCGGNKLKLLAKRNNCVIENRLELQELSVITEAKDMGILRQGQQFTVFLIK